MFKTIPGIDRLSIDDAYEYLQKQPEEIRRAWASPYCHIAGRLFEVVVKDTDAPRDPLIGCLTQIRSGNGKAFHNLLTAAIQIDRTIPNCPEKISESNLHVFMDWQKVIAIFREAVKEGIELMPVSSNPEDFRLRVDAERFRRQVAKCPLNSQFVQTASESARMNSFVDQMKGRSEAWVDLFAPC